MSTQAQFDPAGLAKFAEMDAAAPVEAARFLKSLAHRDRLKLLCCLVEAELSVSELEQQVGISQSAMSQHLLRLKSEGILSSRRDGRQIFYSIADPLVLQIVSLLYGRFCAAG